MTTRPTLDLDDPLADTTRQRRPTAVPDPAPPATPRPAPVKRTKPAATKRPAPVSEDRPPAPPTEPWRQWQSAGDRAITFRLHAELVAELDERAHDLRVTKTDIVTAALLALLDEDDDALIAAVDRAQDARQHGRRQARRQAR